MARRFDTSRSRKAPEFTENGWLKADATLTRCGVFKYRNADGTIRRELRHPDDVFKADSLATLELVPITNRHPPEELLDGETAKLRQVGQVGDSLRRDGSEIRGRICVTDAEVVSQVRAKEAYELSCGYDCRMDAEAGTFEGEAYDCRQRDIRYNHVAIVQVGRAGTARIHLDADDAVLVEAEPRPPAPKPEASKASVELELGLE